MARPLRIDVEDAWYHVTSRCHGNDGRLAKLAGRLTTSGDAAFKKLNVKT